MRHKLLPVSWSISNRSIITMSCRDQILFCRVSCRDMRREGVEHQIADGIQSYSMSAYLDLRSLCLRSLSASLSLLRSLLRRPSRLCRCLFSFSLLLRRLSLPSSLLLCLSLLLLASSLPSPTASALPTNKRAIKLHTLPCTQSVWYRQEPTHCSW